MGSRRGSRDPLRDVHPHSGRRLIGGSTAPAATIGSRRWLRNVGRSAARRSSDETARLRNAGRGERDGPAQGRAVVPLPRQPPQVRVKGVSPTSSRDWSYESGRPERISSLSFAISSGPRSPGGASSLYPSRFRPPSHFRFAWSI